MRGKSAFGESAVTDLAPPGTTHEAGFADAERREIVMQHEALGGAFARFQQFDALFVVLGAERNGDQRLGFAAGEDCGTVDARQNAAFDRDLADLIESAAIGTAVRLQHFVAEDPFLQKFEERTGLLEFIRHPGVGCRSASRNRFHNLGFDGFDFGVAFELGVFLGVHRVGQFHPSES